MSYEAKKVNITIGSKTNADEQLTKFIQLCKTIQYLCSVGSSRTITIWVDGDGAADLRFDFGDLQDEADKVPLAPSTKSDDYRLEID